MKTQSYYAIPVKWLVIGLMCILLAASVFIFASSVMATRAEAPALLPGDGRINVVTHFGGDAFYCVDANLNPTHQYSDSGDGGFRLLDINGQALWFVPTSLVAEKTAEAAATGQYTLVAEGQGTYGPVSLYTFVNGDGDILFTFNGFDEWGKPNSMTFKFCEPVNPIPQPAADDESSTTPEKCSEEEVDNLDSEEDFLRCYNLACPDIDLEEKESQACFCSQYPDFEGCSDDSPPVPEEAQPS